MGINWMGIAAFLFVAAIIVFAVWADSSGDREFMKRIRDRLAAKGAADIVIVRKPWETDRNFRTYQVQYVDAAGTQHDTTCKVNLLDATIYWQDEA
jgi:hypothetical protein